jgi:glycosyltransferase involved in cell wall biosynthesis
MAMGLPAICLRSGALPEMVVHEKTGLVCEESVTALAEAMNRTVDDIEFRADCAVAAKQRYEERWSPDRVHESWSKFFNKMRKTQRI